MNGRTCNGNNERCGPSKNSLGIKLSMILLENGSTSVAVVGDAMLLLLLMELLQPHVLEMLLLLASVAVAASEAMVASEAAAALEAVVALEAAVVKRRQV